MRQKHCFFVHHSWRLLSGVSHRQKIVQKKQTTLLCLDRLCPKGTILHFSVTRYDSVPEMNAPNEYEIAPIVIHVHRNRIKIFLSRIKFFPEFSTLNLWDLSSNYQMKAFCPFRVKE